MGDSVLFLRASDARIFDRIERRSGDRITPPPQPPLHTMPEEAEPPHRPPGRPPDSPPPTGPPIAATEPPGNGRVAFHINRASGSASG